MIPNRRINQKRKNDGKFDQRSAFFIGEFHVCHENLVIFTVYHPFRIEKPAVFSVFSANV